MAAFRPGMNWTLLFCGREICPEQEEYEDIVGESERIFRLIDGIGFPLVFLNPEDLEPMGIRVPRWQRTHEWISDIRIQVLFRCVDDGGFLGTDHPQGRKFVLSDDRGLHAVLEFPDDSDDIYGNIEGYMGAMAYHKVLGVDVREDNLLVFDIKLPRNELYDALENAPVWNEYNLWRNSRDRRWESVLRKELERMMQSQLSE